MYLFLNAFAEVVVVVLQPDEVDEVFYNRGMNFGATVLVKHPFDLRDLVRTKQRKGTALGDFTDG